MAYSRGLAGLLEPCAAARLFQLGLCHSKCPLLSVTPPAGAESKGGHLNGKQMFI